MGNGSQGRSAPLFAKSGAFDTELDALFAAVPAPQPASNERTPPGHSDKIDVVDDEESNEASEEVDEEGSEEADEEGNAEGEDAASDAEDDAGNADDADVNPDEWDGESLPAFLQHTKPKLEDADDLARDKRTIFLGNVPMAALTSRLLRHIEAQSPYPECTAVVSLRFRSVSFAVPTSDMALPDDGEATAATRRRERARKFRELQGEPAQPPPLTGAQKRKIAYINKDVNERADTVNAYARLGEPALVHRHRRVEAPLDERLRGPVLALLVARAVDNSTFGERHLRADLVQALAPHEIVAAGLDQVRLADGSNLAQTAGVDPKRTIFVGNLDFETTEEEIRALFERLAREERGDPAPMPKGFRLDGTPSRTVPGDWVVGVRIVRDKATQLGKGFAYVKFVDSACVDEMVAMHEAEEAFVAAGKPQVRGGARSAAKAVSKPALAEGQEFRRRLKLRKRALRVSRCRQPGSKERALPQALGKRGAPAIASPETKRRVAGSPRTPLSQRPARWRSSGAPTPGGSSPDVRVAQRQQASLLATMTKEQRATHKKQDPERQARRLEKKQTKKQAQKMASRLGEGRERVKLPQRGTAKKMAGVHGRQKHD